MRKLLAAALAVVQLAPAAGVGWHEASLTTRVEFENFRTQHTGFVAVVYAPWCGHSRALLPEVEGAAKRVAGVPFVKIDGTEATEVADLLDVKGYPMIYFVRRGDGPPIEYEGPRQAKAIGEWALTRSKPVVPIADTAADVLKFITGRKIALVLFVADATAPEAEALEAVSATAGTVLPCAISTADPSAPGLGMLTDLGDLARPILIAFSTQEVPTALRPADAGGTLTHGTMLQFGRAASLPAVSVYSAGEVEETLFAADLPLHLLFFHAGPFAGTASEALRSAGVLLRGEAAVATVDASVHPEVAAFFDIAPAGSLKTPTLIGFSLANGTKFHLDAAIDAPAIVSFAKSIAAGSTPPHIRSQPELESIDTSRLVELVGTNFDRVALDPTKDVLVQFYDPNCGHCRKLRPVYEQVAAKFANDESVVVAQIDGVSNDVLVIDPEGFPTIILYPKLNKRGVEYDGSRDMHDIIQFVNDARAGRNFIGGLPPLAGGGVNDYGDEDDGYRVEL